MTDFYTVSSKQTVVDIPDFNLVYKQDPNGPDFTADSKVLAHDPARAMPMSGIHRVVFDFVSGNFFTINGDAHIAIVTRCDTVALNAGDPRGAGMIIGNVSGYPGGRGNPVHPSAQIEAFYAGVHPYARNDLLPESSWSGRFQENTKYRIVVESLVKADRVSHTAYEIHKVADDGSTTELYRTGFIKDGNTWYDPTKNGTAIAYVLGNGQLANWTLKFSNVKSIIADIPPAFASATTNAAGTTVAVTFDEALESVAVPTSAFDVKINGVSSAVTAVSIADKTVSLTISKAAVFGEVVTVSYTQPGDTAVALQDADGTLTASMTSRPVTNAVGEVDTTPPVAQSATTDAAGTKIVITYNKALDTASVPATSAYEVLADSVGIPVTAVAVIDSRVELTLASTIKKGQNVLLNYAVPTTGAIQDKAGNKGIGGNASAVTNAVFVGNPNNQAGSYKNWAEFEDRNFNLPGMVITKIPDFNLDGNSEPSKFFDIKDTGGFNKILPGTAPTDASIFRVMYSFYTEDYFAKNIISWLQVFGRTDGAAGASSYVQCMSEWYGDEDYIPTRLQAGSLPPPNVKTDIGAAYAVATRIDYTPTVLLTLVNEIKVQGKVGGGYTCSSFYSCYRWENGAPQLASNGPFGGFGSTSWVIEENELASLEKTGILFTKKFVDSNYSSPTFTEDKNWKIEFTNVKAGWARGSRAKPEGDAGPKGNRKVTVTTSHPDLIKFDGLEEFIAKPFREDSYSGNQKLSGHENMPVRYSSNGAQVRSVKGEKNNMTNSIAVGGESRLWYVPTMDGNRPGALNLSNLKFKIEVEDDGKRDYATRFMTTALRKAPNWNDFGSYTQSIVVDIKNFDGSYTSRDPGDGAPSAGRVEYFVGPDDNTEIFREKSITFNVGYDIYKDAENQLKFGNFYATVGSLVCDPSTTVTADSIVFLHNFGDILYQEYQMRGYPMEQWKIISSKTLAENAWVEIVIPIDLNWGQEGTLDGGGSTTPSIPQLPTLFGGKEPPKTPEATVDFAAQIVSATTSVPVNPKQFATLTAAAAAMGPTAYKRSRFAILLNAGDVLSAADALGDLQTYIDLKLDDDATKALEEAKKLHAALAPLKDEFLKGGYLDEFGEYQDTPQSIDAMQSVPGYVERPQFLPNEPVGFQDPHKMYPKPNNKDEPDTSRLTRQERARATQQFKKEQGQHKDVIQANQTGTWTQPASGYNARYPYNHATTTESGHVFELDDTPGSERINMYHRTGTFFEIDNTGTQVRRTVGDDYTILERDGKVHIIGNADVTVGGAKRVRIESTFDLEVHGATNINIFNDVNLRVSGDVTAKVSGALNASVIGNTNVATMGTMQLRSNGNMMLNTEGKLVVNAKGNIEMNSSADIITKNTGAVKIGSGGDIALDGSKTYLQSGGATSGAAAVAPFKIEKDLMFDPRKTVLPPMKPRSRSEEAAAVYESPDEGTQQQVDAWQKKRVTEGTTNPVEQAVAPKTDEKAPAEKGPAPKEVDVKVPEGREFRGDDKLSKYFTLADLTHKYSRKLTDRFGNTAQDKFKALSYLATNALDIIKSKYPSMTISSGLRDFVPPGGAQKSKHLTGHAVDIQFPGLNRKGLQERAKELSKLVPYDQMLLEYASGSNGWIHISLQPNPRGQAFTMNNHRKISGDGEFVYVA